MYMHINMYVLLYELYSIGIEILMLFGRSRIDVCLLVD